MIDNICKFLAESFSSDFASWLLGKPIELTKLEPSELLVEPIRADSVIFLEASDLILHIEFQTEPNRNIPFRMADYRCNSPLGTANSHISKLFRTITLCRPISNR
jgi:predicted transposase/invertase (TIGR01784 family)|nr:hypothetical protein [Pseudanabaena cinerea]